MLDRRSLITRALAAAVGASAAPRLVAAADLLDMADLYAVDTMFSDLARAKDGERVRFRGYMSPPLIAETNFYVLSDVPMSVCPFCETESEWPNTILGVYAKRVVEFPPFWKEVETTGVLRLGAFEDPQTGFLSMVRLEDATHVVL